MRGSCRRLVWSLLVCILPAAPASATDGYALQLDSNERGFTQSELDSLRAEALEPYVTVYEAEGGVTYLLRAGEYASMADAFVALQSVHDLYPDAWVVAVERDEELDRSTAAAGETRESAATASAVVADGSGDTRSGGASDPLEEARGAAMNGDYGRAIRLYERVLRVGDETERRQSMELLAVAREYNGQDAHAKNLYERYLETYPDDPDSERVAQRLAALVTRDLPMNRAREPRRQAAAWNGRGMFSQYYRRYAYALDGADEVVSVDALYSDLYLDVRRRQQGMDLALQLSGSHIQDFVADESDLRLSNARIDLDLVRPDLSLRLGRQSRHAAGILGRFDGLYLGVGVTPWLRLGAVGGYAVRSTFDSPNTDRPFYGVSATIVGADERWQIEPFVIEQQADGLTDRRAVGAEMRYYGRRLTLFNLVDYDVYHEVLNNVNLIAYLDLGEAWRLHGSYDHRRSPYLTTENALIGQGLNDLSELEQDYASQEILELANDRTATADLASLGVDRSFGDRYLATVNVSYSDYSETQASGDVPATASRSEFYYTGQLRADDAFGAGSFASVQLRYVDGETADFYTAYLMTRLPLSAHLYLDPRLRYDYRDYRLDGQTQSQILPSLRLGYRNARRFDLEIEVGYEWTRRELALFDLDATGYYVRAGYRSQF